MSTTRYFENLVISAAVEITAADLRGGDEIISWWSSARQRFVPYHDILIVGRVQVEDESVFISVKDSPRSGVDASFCPKQRLEVVRGAAKPAEDLSRYPHRCPRCQAPAYIGFASTECSVKDCQ